MGEVTFQPDLTGNAQKNTHTQTYTQLCLENEATNFLGKYF